MSNRRTLVWPLTGSVAPMKVQLSQDATPDDKIAQAGIRRLRGRVQCEGNLEQSRRVVIAKDFWTSCLRKLRHCSRNKAQHTAELRSTWTGEASVATRAES